MTIKDLDPKDEEEEDWVLDCNSDTEKDAEKKGVSRADASSSRSQPKRATPTKATQNGTPSKLNGDGEQKASDDVHSTA